MVFNDINSVMAGTSKDGKCYFKGIPLGQKITLFAYSIVDENIKATSKSMIVNDYGLNNLPLKDVSIEEFKALASSLDNNKQ